MILLKLGSDIMDRMLFRFLTICLFYGWMLPLNAVEVGSVIRDYVYPDIFNFKSHLVGKPLAHKFFLLPEEPAGSRAEEFRVTLRSDPMDTGRPVQVVMRYKPRNERDILEKIHPVSLGGKKTRVHFLFSSDENRASGRVEFFEVLVRDAEGQVLDRWSLTGRSLQF